MIVEQFEQKAKQSNTLQAAREFSQEDLLVILNHYYKEALPIRSNCQNVTRQQSFFISSMCQAYNHLEVTTTRLRPTACALPHSLVLVGKLLRGKGII